MTDAFADDRPSPSPEDVDDAVVDALLRGAAPDEPPRERRRVEEVVRSIRGERDPGLRVSAPAAGRRRWVVGSLASLASAAVVVLAVLVVREPQAGAASILDLAVVQARHAGPRSFSVEIEFDVPEGHRTHGRLDLLLPSDGRPLVRLATSDAIGGDRLSGWDLAGPWIRRPDGEIDRPDPRVWTRRFLGGTIDLLVDDLPGFLAGLPLEHDVAIDEASDGRPRIIATRRRSVSDDDRPRPGGRRPDPPHGPPPPDRGGGGPPDRIELIFDPENFEVAELGMDWVREPSSARPRPDGGEHAGPGPMPPPPTRWIRLLRVEPQGLDPDWYSAPES